MTSPMGQNRDVNVTVNANVDPYTKSMTAASQVTNQLTDGLKKLDDKIQSIVKRAGIATAATGAGGILGLLGSAKEAAQLEQSFSSLAAMTVRSGESMDKLATSAKNMSREIPVSTQAIAGLMTQVKALGVEGVGNITKLTEVSAKLSAATNTPPGALFQGIAELTRTFGNSIQNIDRYGSSVTALSQKMGVGAGDIVGFAGQIQAVAQKAGIAETQVLGLAAASARVGADGFAGATTFNQIIGDISTSLETNSDRLNTYANLLGVTREKFKDLAQGNAAEAFVQVMEAIQKQGNGAVQTLQMLGLDSTRTMRVIAQYTSGQANLRQALGLSSSAYVENTATADAAAKAWEGTSSSFEKAKNSAKNLATTIGGPISDALKPILDVIASVMSGIDDLFAELNKFGNLGSWAVTLVSGGAMVVGMFTTISWSAIKFLSVWRMVTGALGINAFRGLADGLRGTERSLEGVSKTGQGLYNVTRGLGAGAMGRGEGTPSMLGRGARAVATFPLTRGRQMGRELFDTLRYPFSPEKRNMNATDPWSGYAMWQKGDQAARKAAQRVRETMATNPRWAATAMSAQALGSMAASSYGPRLDRVREMAAPITQRVSGWGTTAAQAMQARLRGQAAPEAPTPPAAEQSTSKMAAAFSRVSSASSKMAGDLGEAGRVVTSGFGKLASGLTSFLGGPWGILAMVALPLVIDGLSKFANAAVAATDKLAYTGAEMAQRLGRDFVTPEQRAKTAADTAPEKTPFGAAEVQDARSSSFKDAYSNTLTQLKAISDKQYQLSRLQEEVNRNVQQNNGAPLDDAQQAEIRKIAIAAFGTDKAPGIVGKLDMTGRTSSDYYGQAASAYVKATGANQDALRGSLASTINTDVASGDTTNAAWVLANVQAKSGGNALDPNQAAQYGRNLAHNMTPEQAGDKYATLGSQQVADLTKQIVTDYNDAHKDHTIDADLSKVNDVGSFIDALKNGNEAAKKFAADLESTGLKVDASGAITQDSLKNLAKAMDFTAAAATAEAMASKLDKTTLNKSWQSLSGNSDSYINSALGSPSDINYQRNLNRVGEVAGYAGGADSLKDGSAQVSTLFGPDAASHVQERIKQLTELKNVIGNPNDPTYQALDKLLGTAYSQLGTVSTLPSAGPTDALRAQADSFSKIDTSNPLNASQFAAGHDQLVQSTASSLETLHSYWLQIRETNRQIEYGQEDHNRSMAHMQRDFDIQVKESAYSRQQQLDESAHSYTESLRSMKYAYDEAFGDPAAFVQSKYTEGASSSLLGMQRQVEYLQRSLSGLQNLRGMGVSNDVIKLLGLDKPENFQQVEKYLTDFANNPQLIQKFNETISSRLSIQDAITQDPSNSQLTELNRQFDWAASQATKQYDHATQVAKDSFDRGVGDMTESYRIGLSRTYDEMSRIGENTAKNTQDMLAWAASSGIAGVADLGNAIGGAIDTEQKKLREMLGLDDPQGPGYHGPTQAPGVHANEDPDVPKASTGQYQGAAASKGGGTLGNAIGTAIANGTTAAIFDGLNNTTITVGGKTVSAGGGKGGGKTKANVTVTVDKPAIQETWSAAADGLKTKVDTSFTKKQAVDSFNTDLVSFAPHRHVDTTWDKQQAVDSFNSDLRDLHPHRHVDTTWDLAQTQNSFNAALGQWHPQVQAVMAFDSSQVASALSAAVSAASPSAGSTPNAPTNVSGNQKAVMDAAAKRGWGNGAEWNSLYALVMSESGFRNTVKNPTSSAYGMFQLIDSNWNRTDNVNVQAQTGLDYIASRYGDPIKAWNFHKANGWYAKGAVFNGAQTIGVGEAGPEAVLPLNALGAEFVARTLQASLRAMNVPTDLAELRRQRTGGSYASPQAARTEYHHVDQSTTFSGAITVQASDPRELQRQLDAQKRAAALTRPMARR